MKIILNQPHFVRNILVSARMTCAFEKNTGFKFGEAHRIIDPMLSCARVYSKRVRNVILSVA